MPAERNVSQDGLCVPRAGVGAATRVLEAQDGREVNGRWGEVCGVRGKGRRGEGNAVRTGCDAMRRGREGGEGGEIGRVRG